MKSFVVRVIGMCLFFIVTAGILVFSTAQYFRVERAVTLKKWFNAGAAAGLTACQLTEDFNATSNYVEREFKQYWKEWEGNK